MMRPVAILVSICLSAYAVDIPSTLDANGQIYKGATYMSHDATSMTIMHESGVASVPLASLPDGLRNQLGYRPGASSTVPVTTPDGAVGRSLDECRAKYGELVQDEEDSDVFHAHKIISGGTEVKISLTFKDGHCVKIEYRKTFVPGAAQAARLVRGNYMAFFPEEAKELRAINFGSSNEEFITGVGSPPVKGDDGMHKSFRISENKKFVSPLTFDPVTILAIGYVNEDAVKTANKNNSDKAKALRAVSERMGGL